MKFQALALIMMLMHPLASQATNNIVPASELSVAGVRLGESEKATIRKLGKPIKRTNNNEGWVLLYEGLTVTHGVASYGAFDMESKNPKYCTPKKACPGMSVYKLKQLYGEPLEADRDEGKFLEYMGKNTTCWLQIAASDNVVKSIRVACQP